MRRSIRLLLPLVLTLFAVPAGPAQACINGVLGKVDEWTQAVLDAEAALEAGDHTWAARRVIRLFPGLLGDSVPPRRAELFERSRRVLALAIARAGARFIRTEMARDPALTWAALTLRARRDAHPHDPGRAADLAEALAQLPDTREEAYALLSELAQADLMPGPRGWALLGELARLRGMPDFGRGATSRCLEIAREGSMCSVSPLV